MGVECTICKHCGFMPTGFYKVCPYCNTPMTKYDTGYSIEDYNKFEWDETVAIDHKILEEVIKKSPDFSQAAMDSRKKQQDENLKENVKKQARSGPTIRCPYCSSTNTRKATGGSYVSNSFFGIFSKGFGKQWHCSNCGSDF